MEAPGGDRDSRSHLLRNLGRNGGPLTIYRPQLGMLQENEIYTGRAVWIERERI